MTIIIILYNKKTYKKFNHLGSLAQDFNANINLKNTKY